MCSVFNSVLLRCVDIYVICLRLRFRVLVYDDLHSCLSNEFRPLFYRIRVVHIG